MTTLVRFKQAAVSVLRNRPALEGVAISYAEDVRNTRKERVFFGTTEDNDAEPVTMRATKVRDQEEYTVILHITASARSVELAEERAVEILDELRSALAEDAKLSTAEIPPGINWATYAGFRLSTSIVGDAEAVASMEVDIDVTARNR